MARERLSILNCSCGLRRQQFGAKALAGSTACVYAALENSDAESDAVLRKRGALHLR